MWKSWARTSSGNRESSRWEKECLARIPAIRAPTSIAGPAAPTQMVEEDEEASIDEISPVILSVACCYLGLPKTKIVGIYENYFKLENVY